MSRYHRLSLMEREELSRMVAAGASVRGIARGASQTAQSTVPHLRGCALAIFWRRDAYTQMEITRPLT